MNSGWHQAMLGLAFAVLLGCILLPLGSIVARADIIETSGSYEVAYGGFEVLLHFQAGEQAQVEFAFSVLDGGPVDILVLDESGYEMYRMGLNPAFILRANLNQSAGNGDTTSLVSGQEYYIVADNTDIPTGGADPSGNVVVSWEMVAQDVTVIHDFEGFIFIFLVVMVIFVLVLLVLYRSRRAEREPGAYVMGMERKYCPKCGQIVEMYIHKCPKCGHEW